MYGSFLKFINTFFNFIFFEHKAFVNCLTFDDFSK